VLVAPDRVIGKYIGMVYPEGRDLNLYFVMALKMIGMAIERGIGPVEMGVTTYPTKLPFGGHRSAAGSTIAALTLHESLPRCGNAPSTSPSISSATTQICGA
jgi:hypothetical protein